MRKIFDIDPKKSYMFTGLPPVTPTFMDRIAFMDWRGQLVLGSIAVFVLMVLGEIV